MPFTAAERAALIERYARGPATLKAALTRVPREALQWRPAPKRWSAHEIIVHCADSETNAYSRLRFLLAEPKPVIQGYDQDRWAQVLDYHESRVELALAAVDVMRAHTVGLLRRMPEAAWASEGTHSESGRYTAEDWLKSYAEHLEKHSQQIERTLESWRAEQTQPG